MKAILCDLIVHSEAPYDWDNAEAGVILGGSGDWPDLEVDSAQELPVKSVKIQMLRVRGVVGSSERIERAIVRRLVAVLEDDSELDFGERLAIPAELAEAEEIQNDICEACRHQIRPHELVVLNGKGYHDRCVE